VGCRDGVEGADVCFLMKSVRIAELSEYMGSDMLAEILPKLPLKRACFRRYAPNKQKEAHARRTPVKRPGKKPTRIAAAGNALQLCWSIEGFVVIAGAVGVANVFVTTGTMVAVDVPLEELVGDGEDPWLAFSVHSRPLHE
jgi:hypothetical protein